jgi:hypothetical protein
LGRTTQIQSYDTKFGRSVFHVNAPNVGNDITGIQVRASFPWAWKSMILKFSTKPTILFFFNDNLSPPVLGSELVCNVPGEVCM